MEDGVVTPEITQEATQETQTYNTILGTAKPSRKFRESSLRFRHS